MILELSFSSAPEVVESSTEEKTYATTYKQAITGAQPITFTLPGVSVSEQGEAILRLGIGRLPGSERIPSVFVNGTSVEVPSDYRGDIQADRDIFFGLLEIPVPYSLLLNGENLVEVSFSDTGGFISSCALQTFAFTREISRDNGPDRERLISFTNREDFVPEGGSLPVFNAGQRFNAEIAYQTGIVDGIEEDLNYVALQLRQVDESFNIVNTSAFNAVVNGGARNQDRRTINYTLPLEFADDTAIPTSAELPEGHKLLLLIFMSVDDDAGFANANTEIITQVAPDRARSINWTNKEDYIPDTGTVPTFLSGGTFPVNISYATASSAGVEETLNLITMMVRQVDENAETVKTSSFNVIVNNSAPNVDDIRFEYSLPTDFDDGSEIPITNELPTGHKLILLIEMSIVGETPPVNDNTEIIITADTGDRERFVSFVNKADYIPAGTMQPVFEAGETFSATIGYGTGKTQETEEDLNYVAMMVRQVNENFAIVNTSTFNVVISGEANNAGERTFDYTLPTTFDDGTAVPFSNDLPTGHQLLLLVFMSVDNDMGFADDNTVIIIEEPTSIIGQSFRGTPLEVFPNPGRDILILKSIGSTEETIFEVIDAAGRNQMVKKLDILPEELILSVSSLKPGAYFIRVSNQEVSAVVRFIKQ